mmetsp:Transcript_11051/g.16390  ORF Transcript_11051/g.16390 Transcript_11051/m.16390 type:complete len:241 (+) Transcript_11051:1-723(+)
MDESEESKERESPTSDMLVENTDDTLAKQETVVELSLVPVDPPNKSQPLASAGTNDVGQETTPKVKKQVDPAANALVLVHNFSVGEVVLYSSSQGEHHRATVVKLLKDKKHRPYYVVRLPEGKEKQVYDHRLSALRIGRTDSSIERTTRSGRSRSTTRRRSRSEVPSSIKTLNRSDSKGSNHGTPNMRYRRVSTSSDEKRKSISRSKSLSRRSASRGPRSRSRATSRSRDQMKSLRKSIR